MNSVDAIITALTPGSVFNQNGKVFRSAKALAQFASVPQAEILGLIAENLQGQVTIRPSAKRPENGPLIALTQYVPLQEQNDGAQVQIVAGNAIPAKEPLPAPEMPQEPLNIVLDEDEPVDDIYEQALVHKAMVEED